MSLVIVTPETVAAAALDVARIGSSIGAANAAAAGSTTSVLAAGADEVSAAIATLFGSHAREYQAISTQVAAFHDRFAQTLSAAVGSYVSAAWIVVPTAVVLIYSATVEPIYYPRYLILTAPAAAVILAV
ncbi:PE family protein, partial [Mycobacterium tuberculosis]|uniref:PE family protein n=1 Tax=Mycobacterium tuberculosis TaxID=1773 RepID=UPI001F226A0E